MSGNIRTGSSWKIPRCRLVMLTLLASALTGASMGRTAEPSVPAGTQMCWSKDDLTFKPGEERIQTDNQRAFVFPPNRKPLASTPLSHNRRRVIRRVNLPPGKKVVALTFDLCEQPHEITGYQGNTVDFLRTHKIKATFFAGGKWMLSHRERSHQLMSDPLFEIGNHTWEHRNLRILSGSTLVKEIERAQTAYEFLRETLAGRQCFAPNGNVAHDNSDSYLSLFRFPFGACNDRSLEAVGEMGLRAIQWDVSSGDPWPGLKTEDMVRDVLARTKPGSIILFHANGRGWNTPSALPTIVRVLEARGYTFAKVSELLELGEPVYSSTCYDSRIGDTDRYDKLAKELELFYGDARRKAMLPGVEGVPIPIPARRPTVPSDGKELDKN